MGDKSALRAGHDPVDGGFTQWSEWDGTSCSGTCGESVTRREGRRRSCTNPAPANGGSDCTGSAIQNRTVGCGLTGCPVNGGFSQWTDWNDPGCSVTCGETVSKTLSRKRSCTNPTPANGGTDCAGPTTENTEVSCGVSACPDPVNGGFTQWSEWSGPPCSVTCGETVTRPERRRRPCTNPAPANGGSDCTGAKTEIRIVNCGLAGCPVNGGFSQWSEWNDPGCSVTCGETSNKTLSRERSCTNPTPANGGTDCAGPTTENVEVNCGVSACPVDGGFSEWSNWNYRQCSVTCGQEVTRRARRRTCTNPTPAFNGNDCVGKRQEAETVNCQLPTCSGDD
ncbi:coadhesin-like [Haliotis rubra]|uniref:coadhesin-like n=1 Tax=Haliotis rubra TaxID=36100 RepID=UPI001EE5CC20|nr:coadhesin-like [Haliotis rubra]